jgi:protein-S-isoprenylcysteine O-methyltransferase Ste14
MTPLLRDPPRESVVAAEPRDIPAVIAPPPLIALAALLLGLALDWLLPSFILRGILFFWTPLVVGAILIAAGATMAIVAGRAFLRAGTNIDPRKPSLTLVTGGIFAWVRNPIYVSLLLLTAGFAIALASGWTLVLLVPAANPAFRRGHARGTLSGDKIRAELPRV